MNRPAAMGDLRVEQVFDEELRRYLRVARVVNVGRTRDADELPPLYEPLLVAMSPAAFSLAGFERVDGADFRAIVASVAVERLGSMIDAAALIPEELQIVVAWAWDGWWRTEPEGR